MRFTRIGIILTLLMLCLGATTLQAAHVRLQAPPDGAFVNPVSVFRWTPLDDPDLNSYRLIFARDQKMNDVVQEFPHGGEPNIPSPQIGVRLSSFSFCDGDPDTFEPVPFYWTVAADDEFGREIARSQDVFSVSCLSDNRGFTIISGLVQSNKNNAAIVGARVAIVSATVTLWSQSGQTENIVLNNVVSTVFNGEYVAVVTTSNFEEDTIDDFKFEVKKAGFENKTATRMVEGLTRKNGQVELLPFEMDPLNNTFADVQEGDFAFDAMERLVRAGITKGCGDGTKFCPNSSVTRAQIAVFLERGMRGSNFTPHPAVGNLFLDVPASHWAGGWIELFFIDRITSGCGGMNYCPESPVTRGQMAVFLLKAKHGADYRPPELTGRFQDVPVNHQFAAWIERLAAEGITQGCGNGDNYCPGNPVTRAQMAVFLVRVFDL